MVGKKKLRQTAWCSCGGVGGCGGVEGRFKGVLLWNVDFECIVVGGNEVEMAVVRVLKV